MILFFVENTGFQKEIEKFYKNTNKLSKNQEGEYAKAFETYTASIFGNNISPRRSPSDTRPDIPLTTNDVDNLIGNLVDEIEDSTLTSFLRTLREGLNKIESDDFQSVRKVFDTAASVEKDPDRKLALLQTIGGLEVKGSFGVDILGSVIARKSPRGLTGRQINVKSLLGQGLPEGSSLVIPLVSGVEARGVGAAKTVKSFFERNKDKLHEAITGEYSGKDAKLINFGNSAAVRQVRAKGQNLWMQYNVRVGGQVKSYSAYLPESFKVENTSLSLTSTNIYVSYKTSYENQVIDRLQKALTNQTDKAVDKIIKDSDLRSLLNAPQNLQTTIQVPSGGSIPIGNARVPAYVPRRKSSAFTSRIASIRSILRETRPFADSIGDFITDDTLTALIKREMLRRMPVGPVGGAPKSTQVLTYRTGNFVNSVKVFQDIRNRQISYYYSPNYWVHESTSRNPRNLIRTSISAVALSIFKKKFNIVKTDAN